MEPNETKRNNLVKKAPLKTNEAIKVVQLKKNINTHSAFQLTADVSIFTIEWFGFVANWKKKNKIDIHNKLTEK